MSAAGLLVAAVIVVYLPLFSPTPTVDDGSVVFEHPAVRGGDGRWLTAPFYSGTYRPLWRPLTTLSYRWNWLAAGVSKTSFSGVNLVLLGACAALCFLLLVRLRHGLFSSLGAAGILVLHPAVSESVLRLAGRSELLSNGLLLSALLLYVGRLRRPADQEMQMAAAAGASPAARTIASPWLWIVWGALFLLALLARETALLLPFLVLGYELTHGATPPTFTAGGDARQIDPTSFHRSRLRVAGLALGICVVVLLLWGVAREGVLRGWPPELRRDPAPDYVAALDAGERTRLALALPAHYARMLVRGDNILPDYAHLLARPAEAPPIVLGDPSTFGLRIPGTHEVLQGLALLVAGFLLFGLLRRRFPDVAFGGWILGVGLLAPLPLLQSNGHVASARHLFLPLFGALMVLAGLARAAGHRLPELWHARYAWVMGSVCLVLVLGSAVRTRTVGTTWKTQGALITRLAQEAPLSPEVPLHRAGAALQRSRALRAAGNTQGAGDFLEEAAAAYEEAIGLFPRIPRALMNLGLIRAEQGRISIAARALSDAAVVAARTFPRSALEARVYVALGTLRGHQDRDGEALAAFQKALQADSTNVQALARAGILEAMHASTAREGVRHMARALELDGDRGTLGSLAGRLRIIKQRAEDRLGLADDDAEAYGEAMKTLEAGGERDAENQE